MLKEEQQSFSQTCILVNTVPLITRTIYGILCSGLTDKAKLSFTSSNSSFTECVRDHNPHYLTSSPNAYDVTDNLHLWEREVFSDNNNKPISSLSIEGDYSFTSCTFTGLTSDDIGGGAIYFTLTGHLTLISCIFEQCNARVCNQEFLGGGAVYVESGSLVAISNTFTECSSGSFSGGLLAQTTCISSTVSLCAFISCTAQFGGGLMTYRGPPSSILSTCFITCIGSFAGGGLYHDSEKKKSSIFISDSLFINNSADDIDSSNSDIGGGGFKDYRTEDYASKYSFSFFSRNVAKKGVGHDITSNANSVPESSVAHCFTTTAENSFCNAGVDQNGWLLLDDQSHIKTKSTMLVHSNRRPHAQLFLCTPFS